MKQIIDEVLYDTEQSELLLTYYPGDCFGYHLYQSKSGRFFQEKRDTSALFTESPKLIALPKTKVKKILSEHDTDLYIKLFGNVIDSNAIIKERNHLTKEKNSSIKEGSFSFKNILKYFIKNK